MRRQTGLSTSVSVTGSGASIESVTTPGANGTLPPGTYEIAVRSEHGIAETSDNATVTLARRSTNGLTTYAGTGVTRSDLGSAAAVRDAIEGDTLSQSERVGTNDTVVYAVNASGLAGLPAARNATVETGNDLDRLDGFEFGVRSAGGDDGLTTSDTLGETPRNSTVHVDETGLYVIADGTDALPTNRESEPGEEFIAEFRVIDDRLREAASDPPDGHRVTSTVFADTDRGSLPGGDRERIASGGPVAGGGNGNGGGSTRTGGSAGGTAPTGASGGGGPEGPNAGSAAGTAGNDDQIAPARGVGFGVRPNAERRTPLLDGPIAVSAPTKIGETGATGGRNARRRRAVDRRRDRRRDRRLRIWRGRAGSSDADLRERADPSDRRRRSRVRSASVAGGPRGDTSSRDPNTADPLMCDRSWIRYGAGGILLLDRVLRSV